MTTARAAVLTGERSIEIRELSVPEVGPDDGLLRVEACGLCGTDVEMYDGSIRAAIGYDYPLIPGHEPVGVVEEIGEAAAHRWGVTVGDRVAVEPFIPCGRCGYCLAGHYPSCDGWPRNPMSYGFLPVDSRPGLWGGYAELLYLHPNARLHRVPDGIPPELAVLFNALGAGVRWAVTVPGTSLGDTVVVQGPGQRGLSCVVALRAAGAGQIIVTGLGSDGHRLELARRLGADVTVDVDVQDPVAAVREATGGALADVVVDVTARATAPVVDAVDMVRGGGTIVLAGLKGGRPVPGFVSDSVVLKDLTIRGARGVDGPAYARAIDIIASGRFPLDQLCTHRLPLEEAERALQILAGDVAGEQPVNVLLRPGA